MTLEQLLRVCLKAVADASVSAGVQDTRALVCAQVDYGYVLVLAKRPDYVLQSQF